MVRVGVKVSRVFLSIGVGILRKAVVRVRVNRLLSQSY